MDNITCDYNKDADNEAQAVHTAPPGQGWERVVLGKRGVVVLLYPAKNTGNKGHEPGKLKKEISTQGVTRHQEETHRGDR